MKSSKTNGQSGVRHGETDCQGTQLEATIDVCSLLAEAGWYSKRRSQQVCEQHNATVVNGPQIDLSLLGHRSIDEQTLWNALIVRTRATDRSIVMQPPVPRVQFDRFASRRSILVHEVSARDCESIAQTPRNSVVSPSILPFTALIGLRSLRRTFTAEYTSFLCFSTRSTRRICSRIK